jgi:hypothetical protein
MLTRVPRKIGSKKLSIVTIKLIMKSPTNCIKLIMYLYLLYINLSQIHYKINVIEWGISVRFCHLHTPGEKMHTPMIYR